jgi:mRNA interferase MazF
VKRGDVWTVAGAPGYAGKPRPVVIVQDDRFSHTQSVTVCALTTVPVDAPLLRVGIEPSASNGLRAPCSLMLDKVTTVQRQRLGKRIGTLDATDMVRLNRGLMVVLGLAG